MFERYTEAARRAIFYSRSEALLRGADEIEPRDLLFGLLREEYPHNTLFQSYYESASKLREALGGSSSNADTAGDRDIPLSPKAKMIVGFAAKVADKDRLISIDRYHLLRALIDHDFLIASEMDDLELSLGGLRKATLAIKKAEGVRRLNWWTLRSLRRRAYLLIAVFIFFLAVLYLHFQQ